MEYKCIRCNYKCDNLKRINDHIERKNMCQDINKCYLNDKNILKAKILENLIQDEKKTKKKDNYLIKKIKEEEYNIQESLNHLYDENEDKNVLNALVNVHNLLENNHDVINNFEEDEIQNNNNNQVYNLKSEELILNNNIKSCNDFSNLFDSQKKILNISKHLRIDIIFNYNIKLNVKEVTPFMKNPKMKESIEKLLAVVRTENNKISQEQINKDYEEIRNRINDVTILDAKKIELMFEKTIDMDIEYYLMYYFDEVDQKGFFYIYDIHYKKNNN